jgi:hypothetical protein
MARRAGIVAMALCAIALTVAATAFAADVKRGLRVTYETQSEVFDGKLTRVSGGPGACFTHQKVLLFKRDEGGGHHRIGADRTNAHREYSIPHRRRPGKYYAMAPQSERSGDTCLAVKTKTLTIR